MLRCVAHLRPRADATNHRYCDADDRVADVYGDRAAASYHQHQHHHSSSSSLLSVSSSSSSIGRALPSLDALRGSEQSVAAGALAVMGVGSGTMTGGGMSSGSGMGCGSGMGSVEASVVCAWPRRQAARAVADVPAALAAVLGVQRGQAGMQMRFLGDALSECGCWGWNERVSVYVCDSA